MWNYEEPEKEDIFLENKKMIMNHIDNIHNAPNIKTVVGFLKEIEKEEFYYKTTEYISKTGFSEEVTWDERLIAYVIEFWNRKILVDKLNQEKNIRIIGDFFYFLISIEWDIWSQSSGSILNELDISLLLEKVEIETDIDKIAFLFESINHNSSWGNNPFLHDLCRVMKISRLIDFLNTESDLERIGYYINVFGNSTDYFVLEMFRSLDMDLLIRKIDSENVVTKIMILIDNIKFGSTIGDKSIFQEQEYGDLKDYKEFQFDEFLLKEINLNRIIDKLIKEEESISLHEDWGLFFQDYRFLLSDLIVPEKIEWINETFGPVMDLTEYNHSDYESI